MSEEGLAQVRREVALLVDFENLYYFLSNNLSEKFGPLPVAVDVVKHLKDRIIEQCGSAPIVMAGYADFAHGDLTEAYAMRSLVLLGMHARYVLGNDHKNAADMQLSLDALELMFRNELLNTFVLLAGDRDYIPLVVKLREYGKEVFVVSFKQNTSGDLREIVGSDRMWDIAELLELEFRTPDRRPAELDLPPVEAAVVEAPVTQRPAPTPPAVNGPPILTSEPRIQLQPPAFEIVSRLETEDQEDVLEWLLYDFSNHREIWFSPARRRLGERLPHMSDYEIQKVLNQLRDLGCFAVEKRESETNPYSVIILNYQHPDVIQHLPG